MHPSLFIPISPPFRSSCVFTPFIPPFHFACRKPASPAPEIVKSLYTSRRNGISDFEPGYRLTKQGKTMHELGWRQVTFEDQGAKMLSTFTMDSSASTEASVEESDLSTQQEHLLFKREVTGDQVDDGYSDYSLLLQGYVYEFFHYAQHLVRLLQIVADRSCDMVVRQIANREMRSKRNHTLWMWLTLTL